MTDEIKAGARHSKKDQELLTNSRKKLREIDQHLVDLGTPEDAPDAGQETQDGEGKATTLLALGGDVKALGNGRVGGYLVRFTAANDTDLTGDYFTASTDFGPHLSSPVLYQHGMDVKMAGRVIGQGELKRDDVGVWIEAQLELRDAYEKAIYELAKSGKLGWSSGTAAHLVTRKSVGNATEILSWPLGLDASLTPTPAEPRNTATTVKALSEFAPVEVELDNSPADTSSSQPTTQPTQKDVPTMDTQTPEQPETKSTQPDTQPAGIVAPAPRKSAPAYIKRLGDNFENAFATWLSRGDGGGLKSFMTQQEGAVTIKASNATDMNVGTAADGGDTVPTGFYEQIVARRDEMSLHTILGLRYIPGIGTTVDVPIDNEADGEFVSTNEASTFDLDAPALSKKSLTLVKYSKQVQVSDELLQDTPTNLLAFLSDFVARGMAKTINDLIITEAETTTALKTFASASAIAVNEIDAMVYDADLGNYLDDGGSVAWVMNRATAGTIFTLGSTSIPYYRGNPDGVRTATSGGAQLLGYPVHYTAKADGIGASKKSVFFGNWNQMGYRLAPDITFLRDPYSLAVSGQTRLLYYFRCDFEALQHEALGYGVHPSA